ncbi:acetylglutamate kinase [Fulvivirga sp. RKSG066]|uniref:acetylglutamate kinase n=1 Tax=Fulvivirga aurantia TaxID=2529383 RepID=UPI0012BC70EE|nr:acetylglutamate kinase [Fulvivirga aurantia]MTI22361.1 acetylglutamate kinase [Fulvivirga aurantia]
MTEKSNSKPIVVVKYGGNAMVSEDIQYDVLKNVCALKEKGYAVVIVHGGGPFIQETLDVAQIESEFIGGQRKTTPEALKYVEMALKGQVNGKVVNIINTLGYTAVGLSGRDGKIATAEKLYHEETVGDELKKISLGQVGKVKCIDTKLIYTLLENDFIPVITCIASDEKGNSYNINADLFAGSVAGHLKASVFGVLTDVDGLMEDIKNPDSLIKNLEMDKITTLLGQGVIIGGMIPKVDACKLAVETGAGKAVILNGKKPEQILALVDNDKQIGTTIKK